MERQQTILLIEPFCLGFEHASINAALAGALLHAYPEDRCIFAGETAHLRFVSEIMRATVPDADNRITWTPVELAGRNIGNVRQSIHALKLARTMTAAANTTVRALVYASATELDLLALKGILLLNGPRVPHCAVLHGVLRRSLLPSKPKPLAPFRGLRLAFAIPHPRGLRFIVLGEPLLRELKDIVPRAARHFRPCDLPYVWKGHTPPSPPTPGTPPIFGYLGVSATDGFDTFLQIVGEVRRRGVPAEFRMVGRVATVDHFDRLRALRVDAPAGVLSNEEYAERARSITYALWTIPRPSYRLTASTSFLEALSIVRPGIHLRNSYLEHYLGQMGDAGELYDSPEEIVNRIAEICSSFPAERYRRQCDAILAGRGMFDPAWVGEQLRGIIGELRGEL